MKGVILAAGTGSRLFPTSIATSKHLLQVYDKPLIYYPLSTLLLAGIREIAIVVNESDLAAYKRLLRDGSQFGCKLTYLVQIEPRGIADGLRLTNEFSRGDSICLILGDNIFHGSGVGISLRNKFSGKGALIFGKSVSNPSEYGTVEISESGLPLRIEEKPAQTKGKLAIPGFYFLDSSAYERIETLEVSARGELEITSLLSDYLSTGDLSIARLERGTAWLDAGTTDSLWVAGEYVKAFQSRQDELISSPEEIALRVGNIGLEEFLELVEPLSSTDYGRKLLEIASDY